MVAKSLTFEQLAETADRLTLEEQEALADLLQKRSIESRRRQIIQEARKAQREHAAGKAQPTTVEDLMREIRP